MNNNNLIKIQNMLLKEMENLTNLNENINEEVLRSNALSNSALNYIKSINTQIKIKEIADRYSIKVTTFMEELGISNEEKKNK